VIAKLPQALAPEGLALITVTSILSGARTYELIAEYGLQAEVVAWEIVGQPDSERWSEAHIAQIEQLSDAFRVAVDNERRLVAYLLAVRCAGGDTDSPPVWSRTGP
jgi:hypothetical protein